ncbi:zinc ABC transporter substrate-binding protein [Vannielia litorea]|uniref:High-affinity zinc uptake system protein ZnuA n=1 Tax=Vannielia litorea TaxID=1217970 RepID=A0A1N6EWW4_9RHOB|nr:zinc ABC transporter substrate-binding protein [Vannielia litorea]SIN87582.1 zinc transport system substrate-binding protein [Vannielia litorea]
MRILPSLAALVAATPALAEPKVIADLPPVHSLVAKVMEGVGTPSLLLDQGGSGHGLSLRPSQAAAAQEADLIFWIGPAMSPALEKPFETLAENAHVIALMEQPGTLLIDSTSAEPHKHEGEEGHDAHEHAEHAEEGHEEHEHEEHAEEGHEDHDHEEHAEEGHEEHEHEEHAEEGHEGHDHGPEDPHVWLSPDNARTWLALIAEELAEHDPDNAATYQANAEAASAELDTLIGEIEATLEPVEGREYLSTHRAFAYFEARFHIAPAHALTGIDGGVTGPRAMEEVRHAAEEGITCLITEPDTAEATVRTLTEGTDLKAHFLDPLGRDLTPGPNQYTELLQALATGYADCLK